MSDPTHNPHNPNYPHDPSIAPGPMTPPQQNPQGPYTAPQYSAPQYGAPPQQYGAPQQPGGYGPGSFGPPADPPPGPPADPPPGPPVGPPPGPPGLPPAAPKKSPALWIALGVVLLLLVGGGIFWLVRGPLGSDSSDAAATAKYGISDLTLPFHVGDFFTMNALDGHPVEPTPTPSATEPVSVQYQTPGASRAQLVVNVDPGVTISDSEFDSPPTAYGDLRCGTPAYDNGTLCKYQLTDGVLSVMIAPGTGPYSNAVVPTAIDDVATLAQTYVDYATEGEPEAVAPDFSTTTAESILLPDQFGGWYFKTTPTVPRPNGVMQLEGYGTGSDLVFDVFVTTTEDAASLIGQLEDPQTIFGLACGGTPNSTRTACVVPLANGSLVTTDGLGALNRPDWQAQFTFTVLWVLQHPYDS